MATDPEDELRNNAVTLSLEDGEVSPTTLGQRIRVACPDLPPKRIRALVRLSQGVRARACSLMARVYKGELAHRAALEALRKTYPFLSDDNVQRLHSLGMYAAWKS